MKNKTSMYLFQEQKNKQEKNNTVEEKSPRLKKMRTQQLTVQDKHLMGSVIISRSLSFLLLLLFS